MEGTGDEKHDEMDEADEFEGKDVGTKQHCDSLFKSKTIDLEQYVDLLLRTVDEN